ncbi:MAG: S1 RNA-binding domain-containing protein [Anaerolineae bacterium]|nr:S1 RNA-binding domain-containing protein [Anaerolineae bacterium]
MTHEHKSEIAKPRWWQTLLKGDYLSNRPMRGEIHMATILSIGNHDIFVDLDGKRDGVIPRDDLERVEESYLEHLTKGEKIPVRIIKVTSRGNAVLVSLNQGLQEQDWIRAQQLLESNDVEEVAVVEANRGGLVVNFGRLRGFIPNSHLSSVSRGLRDKKRRDRKNELIGETLSAVVIEVKPRNRRLILSERLAQRQQRKAIFEEIHEGTIATGVVSNLVEYGAFIDLGGVDGLLHISELSWDFVEHPKDVLHEGEEVEVYVLDVDRERERISLSRKRLLPSTWESVTQTLGSGDIVEGTVTDVASFGMFVDIGKGVEGLVHVSALGEISADDQQVEPGARVRVRILEIDPQQERISLRLESVFRGPEGSENATP